MEGKAQGPRPGLGAEVPWDLLCHANECVQNPSTLKMIYLPGLLKEKDVPAGMVLAVNAGILLKIFKWTSVECANYCSQN